VHKIVAIWSAPKPEDAEAFERHYLDVHVPLAAVVPEMKRLVLTKNPAPEPTWYGVAELLFEDEAALKRSMESPLWKKMSADTAQMLDTFKVKIEVIVGSEKDVPLG
jgi:uncharacterized protein (TIGR02118 family)